MDTVTVKAFVEGPLDTLFFIAMPIRPVTIADDSLSAVIKSSLGISADSTITITNAHMSRLTGLYATERGITDLTGLESATNLSTLVLDSTKIADISPLSGLTNLLGLWLSDTKIADISPLSGLTNLSTLDLRNTNITAIDSLSGLTNLSRLYLGGTDITDISPLSGLTNLSNLELNGTNITAIDSLSGLTNLLSLWLDNTNITDISPLSGLTSLLYLELDDTNITAIDSLSGLTALSSLSLDNNRISDLSPLVLNSRLSTVNVRGNPLSAASRTSYIPTLTGRGVTVRYDTLSVAELVPVSGDGQTGPAGTVLANPFVVKVRSKSDTTYAYRNLPVTFSVTAGRGSLSATSDTTDSNGLARTRLTLGATAGMDTVKAVVEGASNTFFIFTTLSSPRSVTIADDSLRAVIKRSLGKTNPADTILSSDMLRLTRLDAPNKGITDLTGLEFATNLDTLVLRSNNITAIDSLSGLTNLSYLELGFNNITAIDSLSGLTNLSYLRLGFNNITDISPLSGLTNLSTLDLRNTNITAIDSLSGLTNLSYLELGFNNITAIDSLSGLTNLSYLRLGFNNITDISPLSGLTNLSTLDLRNTNITAIDSLSGLTNLSYLRLGFNNITDISPLSGLTDLSTLGLEDNNITDISPLSGLTNLSRLGLRGNPLSAASRTSIPTLMNRGVTVWFDSLRSVTIADANLRAVIKDSLGISPDSTITNADMLGLTRLVAPNKGITDLIGLEFATKLDTLDLSNNNITAIGSLAGLTRLKKLSLGGNRISNISSLEYLTHLTRLGLSNNRISNLSPLVSNRGLGSGDHVNVQGNPLSVASRTTYIPTLTSSSRGVTVLFDNLAEARLRLFSGDGQTGIARTPLANPFVVKVRRAHVQSANDTMHVYRNLPVTFSVAAGRGSLSATSDTTDSNGLAQTRLTLGATVGTDTVKAFVEGASDTLIFSTVPIGVTIPDDSLRAVIEGRLGKARNAPIATADMLRLTHLEARNKGITDLTGLEFATNLSDLDLSHNNITAIDSLSSLTNLRYLRLYNGFVA